MPQQVVVIHGGDSFSSRQAYRRSLRHRPVSAKSFLPRSSWKATLAARLGRRFQVFQPQMPNKGNAQYQEWKIWFERMLPFLNHNVILVGHSLGGIFLARYLATTTFPKRIKMVILIAAPDNTINDIGSFRLPRSLRRLSDQSKTIMLFHSPDDPVVAITAVQTYKKQLPNATVFILAKRQHFNQERFPELVRRLKKLP